MDSIIIFLHAMAPYLVIADLLAVICKAAVMYRYLEMGQGEFVRSFFMLYGKTSMDMFGSLRIKKCMLASNYINCILYGSCIFYLFMFIIFRERAFSFTGL
jgi:hypothetical protein